ncbi:IclR family transcriptional regulator [Streptomyces sp. HPF1205]|uniref:IclR family transcriptional regulator n=1 Tax=Streptomyces sp. HPF1205 TaxID=2873262 RepID=UPI0021F110EF|nr:helix-turn-helix domain-containing protein [Streptomyces sp. HPF1205]
MRSGGRGTRGGRGVLEGAFALLEALDRVGEAGLSTLASDAGLPKTSAHRLLDQLVALNAVERSGGRYRVGVRVFRLGRNWQPHPGLLAAAQGPLRRLARGEEATVALTVLRENRTIVAAGAGPDAAADHVPLLVRPGAIWPWPTAAGLVLAAHAAAGPPGEGVAGRTPGPVVPGTESGPGPLVPGTESGPGPLVPGTGPGSESESEPGRPTDAAPWDWDRAAREIRDRGAAFDRDTPVPGVRSAAVPVRAPRGEVIAALCALVPADRDAVPLADALARTAGAIRDGLRQAARGTPVPPGPPVPRVPQQR